VSERAWRGELVAAARLGAWFVVFLGANVATGRVMAGRWDRMPFLIGYVFVFAPTIRAAPPRTTRPLLPLLGRPPVRWWAQSPVVLVPTIVAGNALSGVFAKDGVEHLLLGVGLNLVLVTAVFVFAMGTTWRPEVSAATTSVSAS